MLTLRKLNFMSTMPQRDITMGQVEVGISFGFVRSRRTIEFDRGNAHLLHLQSIWKP